MPAGVSWPKYIKFLTAGLLSMMAGSQTIHLIYRPLEGMDVLVQREIERLKPLVVEASHIKKEDG